MYIILTELPCYNGEKCTVDVVLRRKSMTNKTKSEIDDSPFVGCVLHEKAKSGEWFDYSYPQSGLPELTGNPAPMRAIFANLLEQQKKSALATDNTLSKENKEVDYDPNDPFAGCVLHEKAKSGEWFDYSYPQSGLPELTGKPAPMRAIFANLLEQQKK